MDKDLKNLTEAYEQVIEENKLGAIAGLAGLAAGGLPNANAQNIEDFNVNKFDKPFSVREEPKQDQGLQPDQKARLAVPKIVEAISKGHLANISDIRDVVQSQEYSEKLMVSLLQIGKAKKIPQDIATKYPKYYESVLATIKNN
jgi:hypothetical protein